MALYPMTKNASALLTEKVVAYQEQKDARLHRELTAQIMELIYTIPAQLKILTKEDCCDFLFYCLSSIDTLIASFEVGKLSFLGFLTEVIRRRVAYFISERSRKERQMKLLQTAEVTYQDDGMYGGFETVEPEVMYTFSSLPHTSISSLPTLFQSLLCTEVAQTYPIRSELEPLRMLLTTAVNRKRMLITLTITPALYAHHLLEELSSLLLCDLKELCCYLNTASLAIQSKEAQRIKFEATCSRHFRRLLEIDYEIEHEPFESRREELFRLREWTNEKYRKKVAKLRTMEQSLSHSQVSELLNIPKGTVSSAVHHIKKLLATYIDEGGFNGYP